MKDVVAFLQGSSKQATSPLFLLAVLFLAVLALIYFMNEGFTDSSGNKIDASGNMISLSLSDLIKALSFANKTEKPEDVLNPPVFTPSTNVLPVTVAGGSLSSESEKRIAQQISKNIKDEMLAQRSTTPVIPGECSASDAGSSCGDSAACSQGCQYNQNSPGAPFDSSDYIRKDSIPCWGCTLPQ